MANARTSRLLENLRVFEIGVPLPFTGLVLRADRGAERELLLPGWVLRPREPAAATNPFHIFCDLGGLGGRQCLIRGEFVPHLLAFCVNRRWFTRRKALTCAASQAQPGDKCCAEKLLHSARLLSGNESIDEKKYDDDG